jgi:hypothetical protein
MREGHRYRWRYHFMCDSATLPKPDSTRLPGAGRCTQREPSLRFQALAPEEDIPSLSIIIWTFLPSHGLASHNNLLYSALGLDALWGSGRLLCSDPSTALSWERRLLSMDTSDFFEPCFLQLLVKTYSGLSLLVLGGMDSVPGWSPSSYAGGILRALCGLVSL